MAAHDENASPTLPTLASLTRSRPRRPGSGSGFGVERVNVHSPAGSYKGLKETESIKQQQQQHNMSTPARQSQSKPGSPGSSGSGRKRVRSLNLPNALAQANQTQPAPASPNPKARKQQKTASARSAASNASPTKPRRKAHQRAGSTSSNAGTSPVRYSPPREQFTPPRIVYLPVEQPASRRRGRSRSTSRARSTTPKGTRAGTPSRRAARIPPGSPGDDPILLVGPEPDWAAHARDLEPRPKEEEEEVAIPPTPAKPTSRHTPGHAARGTPGAAARNTPSPGDAMRNTPDDSPAAPRKSMSIFDAPVDPDDAFALMGNDTTAASWDSTDSDSDGDEVVMEEFDVPLKQDPPTARTKARMDRFGRPTSPYPLRRGNNSVIAEEEDEEEDEEQEGGGEMMEMTVLPVPDPDSPLSSRSHSSHSRSNTNTPSTSRRLSGIRRLSQARLRFSSVETDDPPPSHTHTRTQHLTNALPAVDEDVHMSDEHDLDPPQPPPVSTSPEDTPSQRAGRVPLTGSSSGESFAKHGESDSAGGGGGGGGRPATPRGRRTLREMSVDFSARNAQDSASFEFGRQDSTTFDPRTGEQDSKVAMDASDDEDEDEVETGPGVIQISSSDPVAAARAAAILKKHHQYIQEGIRRRQSRSRASSAGRGSPAFSVVSNNDLLRLSEAEVELESALGSPSKASVPVHVPRPWTKDDWKLLDACFSAVREEGGALAVDAVEPKAVVDRFFAVLAEEGRGVSGEEMMVVGGEGGGGGGEWTWDKILRRVIALRAKQRGNPAPSAAATPRSSRAQSETPSMSMSRLSETPSMRVPDFTPVTARGAGMYPRLAALKRPDFDAARATPSRGGGGAPAHGTFEFPRRVAAGVRDVPPQLLGLAPRYNTPARPQAAVHPPPSDAFVPPSTPAGFVPPSTPQRAGSVSVPEPPPSTAKRVMGYLSSWLGVAKPQPHAQSKPQRQGLPPPPPYLPRAVATPPRKPGARPPAPSVPLHAPPPAIREPPAEVVHPRDAVELQHAEPVRHEAERVVPHKETVELQHATPVRHTPARAVNPREMVALQHVSPPPSSRARKTSGSTTLLDGGRMRTASGGSVKDMIKNFEAVAQEKEEGRRRNADLEAATAKMRRTKSLQGLAQLSSGGAGGSGSGLTRTASVSGIPRPAWR